MHDDPAAAAPAGPGTPQGALPDGTSSGVPAGAAPADAGADSPLETVLGPAAEPRSARMVRFSFGGLLVTQFLGAFNDNVLKNFMVLQVGAAGLLWPDILGPGTVGYLSAAFALPFILFSGWAGQLADKFSKRWLAVALKTIEIPIVCLAGVGIHYHNFWLSSIALLLLSAHSAFFGPPKYGMIPEIVPEKRLPRANGSINMTTNVAIIGGIAISGLASQYYRAHPDVCFTVLLGAAILGRITVQFIQPLEPRDPGLRIHPNPFHTYWRSLRDMWTIPGLIRAAIGWSFFYWIGTAVISAVPDLKSVVLHRGEPITDLDLSGLTASLGVAVGVGSLAAGFVSRGTISLRSVLVGGAGMSVGLLIFPLLPAEFVPTLLALIVLGLFAGFYLVPLMSYIQAAAPPGERGQFLGTSNFLSFVMVGVGGGFYSLLRSAAAATPQQVLGANGLLLIAVTLLLSRAEFRLGAVKREAAAGS